LARTAPFKTAEELTALTNWSAVVVVVALLFNTSEIVLPLKPTVG
jgi:hypothetical protein